MARVMSEADRDSVGENSVSCYASEIPGQTIKMDHCYVALLPDDVIPSEQEAERASTYEINMDAVPVKLNDVLPPGPIHIESYEDDEAGGFHCKFRLALKTKDHFQAWKKEFEERAKITWRVAKTIPRHSRSVFREEYRCQHNCYPRTGVPRNTKHTACPATLRCTVKKLGKRTQAKDAALLKAFPTIINLHYTHNHPINLPSVLCRRDVGDDVKEKFTRLFEDGHSVASARQLHTYDLRMEYGESYHLVAVDRAINPGAQWCHWLFRSIFKSKCGKGSGIEVVSSIEQAVNKYNEECGRCCAVMQTIRESICVAVCSPLMQRVHQLNPCSGQVIFVDSTSSVSRMNWRVMQLLAPSPAGGLPVGVLLTTSESEEVIIAALENFKVILPELSFYGRGVDSGPGIFIIDERSTERNCLSRAFPQSVVLLGIYHVLQAAWRFLTDSKMGVLRANCPELFQVVKNLLYSTTEEDLQKHFYDARTHPDVMKNSRLSEYLASLYARRESWAICYHNHLLVHGHNTSNLDYCHAGMKLFKERIFQRCKAFNAVQLFDFITTRLEHYYERRLLDLIDGTTGASLIDYPPDGIANLVVCRIDQSSTFQVHNTSNQKTYEVQDDIGRCSCPIGMSGTTCEHQFAVMKEFGVLNQPSLPVGSELSKEILYRIATGSLSPGGCPQPLKAHEPPIISNIDAQPLPEVSNTDRSSPLHSQQGGGSLSSQSGASTTGKAASTNTVLASAFEALVRDWNKKCINRPDVFVPAFQAFFESQQQIKTDSGLAFALHTFGK